MDLQVETQGFTAEVTDLRDLEVEDFDRLADLLGRLGVPRAAIAGVAREAFLKAPRFTAVCDMDGPASSWLLSIGFEVAADYWRRSQRARHLPGREEMLADESAEATAIELLKLGFEWLPPIRRRVVEMRDLLGLSLPAISDALGITLPKASSHLRLGRRDLAAAIRSVLSAAAAPVD